MALQTTVEHVDGPEPVTVLTLEGELDAAAFEGVIDTVRGMYDAGTRILVLDLTGLWFISSSGLVAIHAAMRRLPSSTPSRGFRTFGRRAPRSADRPRRRSIPIASSLRISPTRR